MKQSKNNWNEFSSYLSEADIIPCGSISELNEYSLINDEILKYFKIQNINILLRAFYFINKSQIYIFYPSQNCLLNAVKYDSNKFKLKNLNIPPPIPTVSNHTLGLENIGATCYMNATLQCLCHVNSLKYYFKDFNQIKIDINNKNTPLTKEFYKVITNLWKKSNNTYYTPTSFKNLISELNPLFKGIQANDSKDLILFIYETLHNELNNPNSNNNNLNNLNNNNLTNELKLFRQNYYYQNNSIISRIFYFEQSSNLYCNSCNTNKISYNIINFLVFPLEKVRLYLTKIKQGGFINVTLEDCFEQNEEKELLNGPNRIYCNNCHMQSDAFSYNKLNTCPEVLTIILNRGKGLEFDVEFKFPFALNISKYIEDKNCDTNYELIGVITHLGQSNMSGHFIAYCKSPNDKKWYLYNDAMVSQIKNVENDINSRGIPYVLFYQKSNYFNKVNQNVININKNVFTLYFTYNDKEFFLDINENKTTNLVIQDLYNKYNNIPRQGVQFLIQKGDVMINLDMKKKILENGLKSGDKIIIV